MDKNFETFQEIIEHVILVYEKDYSNHPRDPGGPTKWGIAKKYHPEVDVENLTLDGAIEIYKKMYWEPLKVSEFKSKLILFDMAVNLGVTRTAKILQKVCGVKQDGVIGPITIAAANRPYLEFDLTVERMLYYATRPHFWVFAKGWFRRSLDVFRLSALTKTS